jgi:hypothetical protein
MEATQAKKDSKAKPARAVKTFKGQEYLDAESSIADEVTKPDDIIKIKFNHPMRNAKITPQEFKLCQQEYLVGIEKEHGRKIAFPNEQQMVEMYIQEKHGQPYIYLVGMEYEMSRTDAEPYLAKTRQMIDPKKQRYIGDVKADLHRYLVDFHFAEIVVA